MYQKFWTQRLLQFSVLGTWLVVSPKTFAEFCDPAKATPPSFVQAIVTEQSVSLEFSWSMPPTFCPNQAVEFEVMFPQTKCFLVPKGGKDDSPNLDIVGAFQANLDQVDPYVDVWNYFVPDAPGTRFLNIVEACPGMRVSDIATQLYAAWEGDTIEDQNETNIALGIRKAWELKANTTYAFSIPVERAQGRDGCRSVETAWPATVRMQTFANACSGGCHAGICFKPVSCPMVIGAPGCAEYASMGKYTMEMWTNICTPSAFAFELPTSYPVSSEVGKCVDVDEDGWFRSRDNNNVKMWGDHTGDCADELGQDYIHPGIKEVCADDVDNNCDDLADCSDSACTSAPECSQCPKSRNCVDRECGNDPVCNFPCGSCDKSLKPQCKGDMLQFFETTGICTEKGRCEKELAREKDCGSAGCNSTQGKCNDCIANCSGRECGPDPTCGEDCGACDSRPRAKCQGDTLLTFEKNGACLDGVCDYAIAKEVACEHGCDAATGQCKDCVPECVGRACGPDPVCGTSCGICDDYPLQSDVCKDDTVLVDFSDEAECSAEGQCFQAFMEAPCGLRCEDAACVEPSLTITFPNSGESLAKGVPYKVTWATNDPSRRVRIHVFKNGTYHATLGADLPNTGSVDFVPPAEWPDGGGYDLRISSLDDVASDISDATFTLSSCVPDCSALQCGPDPLCSVSCGACTTPPAKFCKDQSTLVAYDPIGSCEVGACQYVSEEIICATACVNDDCDTSSADLVIAGIDVSPKSVKSGDSVTVEALLRNDGKGGVAGPVTWYVLSSPDTGVNMGDVQLANFSIAAAQLGRGDSVNEVRSVQVTNIPDGSYYLGAYIDGNFLHAESNEGNNAAFDPAMVSVCSDTCSSGQTRCTNSTTQESCGNYDGDVCAEWGGEMTCSSGACSGSTCTDCGSLGKACCSGNVCSGNSLVCFAGSCAHCGQLGEPCCASSPECSVGTCKDGFCQPPGPTVVWSTDFEGISWEKQGQGTLPNGIDVWDVGGPALWTRIGDGRQGQGLSWYGGNTPAAPESATMTLPPALDGGRNVELKFDSYWATSNGATINVRRVGCSPVSQTVTTEWTVHVVNLPACGSTSRIVMQLGSVSGQPSTSFALKIDNISVAYLN